MQRFEEAAKLARSEYFEASDKNMQLEKQVARQEKEYAAALADKDSLNKVLISSSEEHKNEIESLKAALSTSQTHLQAASKTEDALVIARAEKTQLTTELDRLRTQSEFDRERALLSAEKQHQQELREAYAQHHEELKEYLSRIEKFQTQHDAQAQRIFELEHLQGQKPEKVQKGKPQ